MTDRELLKMALEALEYHTVQTRPIRHTDRVIAKLNQALVQPEQDAGKCGCGANLYIDENGKPCSKAQPEQEPTACGYDETVGMCTNNPCCEQTPVAHLWECIGLWSAYLASNGEKANLAPPEWLVDAVKAATAQPEQEPAHPNPAAKHWHDLYRAKCQDFHDKQAMLGAEIVALEEELEEIKEEIEPLRLLAKMKPKGFVWYGLTEEERNEMIGRI